MEIRSPCLHGKGLFSENFDFPLAKRGLYCSMDPFWFLSKTVPLLMIALFALRWLH